MFFFLPLRSSITHVVVPDSTTTDSLHDYFRSYGPIRDGTSLFHSPFFLPLWVRKAIRRFVNAYFPFLHFPSLSQTTPAVRIVTPPREDRPPYAFVEFESVKSALAAMEEMEFRVRSV